MDKQVEIDGNSYALRQWSLKQWRELQEQCKDKSLEDQWVIVARFSLINHTGDIEDLPLATLHKLYQEGLDHSLPFFKLLMPPNSSESAPNTTSI